MKAKKKKKPVDIPKLKAELMDLYIKNFIDDFYSKYGRAMSKLAIE